MWLGEFRISYSTTKKYALQKHKAYEKGERGLLSFAVSTLCETEKGGVRMMGEGVAKKEMARRTGLSVPTVRKYIKMIRRPPEFPAPSERPPTVFL